MDTHVQDRAPRALAKRTTAAVLEILAGLGDTKAEDIKIDDHLDGHLGLSLRERWDVAILIEQRLGVLIPERLMAQLQLVGSLIAHVVSEVARRPAAAMRPAVDLARVGLDAGRRNEDGLVLIEVFPLGSERRFVLTIAGGDDREAAMLADNIARRLSLNSELLPMRAL